MSEHQRMQELIGPYVLGDLNPEEERGLMLHLRECPDCRAEIEEVREVNNRLSQISASLPKDLKKNTLASIGKLSKPGAPDPGNQDSQDIPGNPARQHRRWPIRLAAAAVVLMALLLGGLTLERMFTPAEPVVAKSSLAPTAIAPRAGGEIQLKEAGPNMQVQLEVWGLPELPSNEYYELWFIKGEDRISGGTFTVNSEGRTRVYLNAPEAAMDYMNIGITSETSPGDPGPSPTKVLGGTLRGA